MSKVEGNTHIFQLALFLDKIKFMIKYLFMVYNWKNAYGWPYKYCESLMKLVKNRIKS